MLDDLDQKILELQKLAKICNEAIKFRYDTDDYRDLTFNKNIPALGAIEYGGLKISFQKNATIQWRFFVEKAEISYIFMKDEERIYFYPWHILAFLRSKYSLLNLEIKEVEKKLNNLVNQGIVAELKIGLTGKLKAYCLK